MSTPIVPARPLCASCGRWPAATLLGLSICLVCAGLASEPDR